MRMAPRVQSQPAGTKTWWRILRTALGFYVGGLLLLLVTDNPALFPTVVLLGSFMVPAAYVAFFYEHRHLSELSPRTTVLSFFYGGVLGVFAAAVLEPLIILQLDLASDFAIGLIEECAKLLGVLVIVRRERHDAELDGLILGVAAGTGFAALESTGYAFGAFVRSGGNLSLTVAVMLLRGLFAPLGHGTWTGILVGVLFRESKAGEFHLNRKVFGAYVSVGVLHGLWDALPWLVFAVTQSDLSVLAGPVIVGVSSLYLFWRRWREAVRLQEIRVRPTIPPIQRKGRSPVG
jgi:RsiW-degrading membrane proteinase PrsW (M82 family)